MNVEQVIVYVQEWIELYGQQIEGFQAAHLMGGILAMKPTVHFPDYRDVDFNIVCDGPHETTTHDVAYRGLILEYSLVSSERYRTSETILANPELASNLARGGILADPYGVLSTVQPTVAMHYPKRSEQARHVYVGLFSPLNRDQLAAIIPCGSRMNFLAAPLSKSL